jgi:hypothetical protein
VHLKRAANGIVPNCRSSELDRAADKSDLDRDALVEKNLVDQLCNSSGKRLAQIAADFSESRFPVSGKCFKIKDACRDGRN